MTLMRYMNVRKLGWGGGRSMHGQEAFVFPSQNPASIDCTLLGNGPLCFPR